MRIERGKKYSKFIKVISIRICQLSNDLIIKGPLKGPSYHIKSV